MGKAIRVLLSLSLSLSLSAPPLPQSVCISVLGLCFTRVRRNKRLGVHSRLGWASGAGSRWYHARSASLTWNARICRNVRIFGYCICEPQNLGSCILVQFKRVYWYRIHNHALLSANVNLNSRRASYTNRWTGPHTSCVLKFHHWHRVQCDDIWGMSLRPLGMMDITCYSTCSAYVRVICEMFDCILRRCDT